MKDKQQLYSRYPDLLNEQSDPDLVRLVDDLDMFYTSFEPPQQLLHPVTDFLHAQLAEMTTAIPGTQPGKPDKLRGTRFVAYRRKAWQQRISAIAAVLLTALLVGSLLVVLSLVHQSNSGAPGNPLGHTPPASLASQVGPLYYLRMVDTTTGWAWAQVGAGQNFKYDVLRTTDGGYHWRVVTPSKQKLIQWGRSYFLNAYVAWVVAPQPDDAPSLLYRTTDGGQTWHQSVLPANQVGAISFVNAQVGWITSDINKAGTFAEIDIFHTTDGGQTWAKVAVSTPATNNVPGALPFNNEDGMMSFVDESTGWVTGSSSLNNEPRIYVTHDGGRTWHRQTLPPPSDGGALEGGTVIWPPQFFSARDGVLPVSFWSPRGIDVYVTHNGGATWQSTSFVHVPSCNLDEFAPAGDPIFVDVNHGWLWEGVACQPHGTLDITTDSGQHWTKIIPDFHSFAISNFDFVSNEVGWAPGYITHSTPYSEPPVLFKTADGGHTWTQIRYVIIGITITSPLLTHKST